MAFSGPWRNFVLHCVRALFGRIVFGGDERGIQAVFWSDFEFGAVAVFDLGGFAFEDVEDFDGVAFVSDDISFIEGRGGCCSLALFFSRPMTFSAIFCASLAALKSSAGSSLRSCCQDWV
jgi:hypothetical protein